MYICTPIMNVLLYIYRPSQFRSLTYMYMHMELMVLELMLELLMELKLMVIHILQIK